MSVNIREISIQNTVEKSNFKKLQEISWLKSQV